jgi:hypothetical protein
VAALSVSVHEFPADAPATIFPERGAYCFWYRPRTEKGDTRVTVPELGLSRHRICRDHVLIFPPLLPVRGQWEGADGRVARFSFAPRFIEAVSSEVGLPTRGLKRFWHAFFSIDHRLEALCWLLMEETESRCPHGQSYFGGLAHALAVGVLSTVRDQPRGGRRPWAVPAGIHRAVQSLETDFARNLSLAELEHSDLKPGTSVQVDLLPGCCRPSPAEPRPFRAGFSAADRPRAAPIPAAGAPEPRAPNVGARKRGHVAERNRGGVRLF